MTFVPAREGARFEPTAAPPPIGDAVFRKFQELFKALTGISLSDQKRALLVGRLGSRLRVRKVGSFTEYYRILKDPSESLELQTAIDLITTNETSFFREPEHFRLLEARLRAMRPVPFPFKAWSAASSSGEEAFTLAMVLADVLGHADWSVLGTDISTRVLERARKGTYPMERGAGIPARFLKAHCLKGQGPNEGLFLVDKPLRDRVTFTQANLIGTLPRFGPFDVAFLRNVLIYFEAAQKRRVVEAVAAQIKPGGLLFIGHAESLTGFNLDLEPLHPTVYRVP